MVLLDFFIIRCYINNSVYHVALYVKKSGNQNPERNFFHCDQKKEYHYMSNPLVSLIIPCYNAEKYIGRMLDSIIMQHYTPFELILINDGSTDNTDAVIQQYLPLLKKNSIDVVYKIQENQGIGATIDNGLKLFSGDYLCWADADDYFEPDAFIERVNFLEKHPEYAIVTSDAYYRPAEKLNEFKKASGGYPNRYEEISLQQ